MTGKADKQRLNAGLSEWAMPCSGLALVLGAGALLRIWGLGAESVWWDEYTSLMHLDAPGLLDFLRLNRSLDPATLPLYYSLEYLFYHYLSESVYALRLFSVFLGLLSIVALYALGRRLFSAQAGLIAAGCLAFSPIHIFHAQGIRMYVLFALLALLSMQAFVRWLEQASLGRLLLLLLVNFLLLWTHPFAAFLLPVQGLFLLAARPLGWRRILLWGGAHGLLILPSLAYFSAIRFWDPAETGAWLTLPSAGGFIGDLLFDDIIRATWQLRVEEGALRGLLLLRPLLDALLAAVLLSGACAGVLLAFRKGGAKACARLSLRRKAVLLLIWWLTPPLFLLALSWFSRPCLFPRYSLHCVFALYLLIGLGLSSISRPGLRRISVGLLFLLLLYQNALVRSAPQRTDWQSAARLIQEEAAPEDILLVQVSIWKEVFAYNLGPHRHPMASAESPALLAEAAAFVLTLPRSAEAQVSRPACVWALLPSRYFDGGPDEVFEAAARKYGLRWTYTELPGIKHLRIYALQKAHGKAAILPLRRGAGKPQAFIQSFGDLGLALAEAGRI